MNTTFLRLIAALIILISFPAPVLSAQLDEYYLNAFGETPAPQVDGVLQKALLLPAAEPESPPHCGMPLKRSLRRDWNRLEPATQKILAKQLAAPVLSGSELTLLSPSGRFRIRYTDRGDDAVPSPSWVQTIARTFDDVALSYSARTWRLAPTNNGAPYDVYVRDLSALKIYGQTTSDQAVSFGSHSYTSYIEIDNDYLDSVYQNALDDSSLKPNQKAVLSLQATAAHEYQHSIQYGYNIFFDTWYAEATSTWMEDELYDDVNHLYNYIPAWFNNSTYSLDVQVDGGALATGAGYGRWIFNRHLAERNGNDIVRGFWEKLAGTVSLNGSDIPMTPLIDSMLISNYHSSLESEFFDFTKKVYTRDWASHTADTDRIHPAVPLDRYARYPVNASSTPMPAVTLPHYSFAYYTFSIPDSTPGHIDLTVSGTSGIRASAFRKNGRTVTEYPFLSVNGVTVRIPDITPSSDVVLLVTNVSAVDGHNASFSTDGSVQSVTEPPAETPVRPETSKITLSGGGGGGGCFIATAAYGSYLHPRVRLLREFRDKRLLTNAPGRVFVEVYYRLSPPIAKLVERHAPLRLLARLMLTPLVLAVAHPLAAATLLLAATGYMAGRMRRRRTDADAGTAAAVHQTL